jgi:ABC-2 type transport system permease protein
MISPWRIEWWRLVRTRRLLALVAVFVFFGFTGPLGARYIAELVSKSSNADRITVIAPPPVPADGVSAYVSNAMLAGLIVSVVIAAYALAVDANPALSVFYRSRVSGYRALILPRVVVTTAGVVVAYIVGLLVAWYETAVLIGAPDAPAMAYTALLGSVYLAFAVAVTALAGTVTRGTLGTVGIAIVVQLLLPIAGTWSVLRRWMPSTLTDAPEALLRHTATDHYPRAIAVTVVLLAGSLILAAVRGGRREVG